jgi:hypothetical protein
MQEPQDDDAADLPPKRNRSMDDDYDLAPAGGLIEIMGRLRRRLRHPVNLVRPRRLRCRLR